MKTTRPITFSILRRPSGAELHFTGGELDGLRLIGFPSDIDIGHQTTFKTVWRLMLRRAKVPYFRIYDLRSAYATRLSAGGVADEWVTQLSDRVTPRSSRSTRK